MTGFVKRKIKLTVQLAPNTGTNQPNTFAESGTDSVTIENLRMNVRIQNSGTPAGNNAQIKIYGLPPSLMNQLATLGLVFNLVPKNTLTVSAGDDEAGLSSVYLGTIWAAYGDYSSQPNVPFHFECITAAAQAAISIPATSFTGTTDVATIMSGLARQMGLSFENNGISIKISNPYFSGSGRAQVQKCAKWANIEWTIENNKLAIWPKGGNRNTPNIPTISPETGMISYPSFTQQGIIVKTVFNPQITFGSLIKVESSVLRGISAAAAANPRPNAGGGINKVPFPTQWAVNQIDHALDSQEPHGQWMSTVYAYNPGYAKGIQPPNPGQQ